MEEPNTSSTGSSPWFWSLFCSYTSHFGIIRSLGSQTLEVYCDGRRAVGEELWGFGLWPDHMCDFNTCGLIYDTNELFILWVSHPSINLSLPVCPAVRRRSPQDERSSGVWEAQTVHGSTWRSQTRYVLGGCKGLLSTKVFSNSPNILFITPDTIHIILKYFMLKKSFIRYICLKQIMTSKNIPTLNH